MIQARIHKRMGDIYAAEESMAAARSLDGQDRFLNAKHVKYLLRIDEVQEAETVATLFIRKDSVDALTDLTEMQCLWFLLEEAESYARQGNLGMALKRYMTIERVFSEIYEDEFEFHSYCMRKFTLRACVKCVFHL
jgi:peptide alpha-N-acetyltransferase